MSKKVVIEAKKVSQSFQVGDDIIPVLKDVSFTITENTFNIVYGPSGSGKSTLLNILTGLQRPTEGEVSFNSDNVYKFKPNDLAHFRANSIGFVYQQNFWVKSLNVLDNIAMPLYFLGYSRKKAMVRAREVLELVGMEVAGKKNPSLLSGGEQQRVAMARAFSSNPDFLVADEPTGSLDSTNGDKIMELLRHSQKDMNHTIILVTHNMEYLPLADNLLHIQDGAVEQMQDDSISATTEKLIKDMKLRINRLAAAKRKHGSIL